MTDNYAEEGNSLKLIFREGEIDFIASEALTPKPTVSENILGREVNVETSAEIVAKKVWHRGPRFKARDMFDLALVMEREPRALDEIGPVLRDRREVVLAHITRAEEQLREDFAALEVLEYRPTYDECLRIVKRAFK